MEHRSFDSVPDPKQTPQQPGKLIILALLASGAVLAGLIITQTFTAYLALGPSPSMALTLNPWHSRALVQRAEADLQPLIEAQAASQSDEDRKLEEALTERDETVLARLSQLAASGLVSEGTDKTGGGTSAAPPAPLAAAIDPGTAKDVAALAARAIEADPLNADAVGILARLADLEGDEARSAQLMDLTRRLSMRESYAVYWLMQRAVASGDTAKALNYLNVLLSSRASTMPYVLPMIAKLAESEQHRDAVIALLATGPPWRSTILARLTGAITDARTPLKIMLALKDSPHPPTPDEVGLYVRFLANRNLTELAYSTWLQFQPAGFISRLRPLQNGGFEEPVGDSPFNWAINKGTSAAVAIRPRPGAEGAKALQIDFRSSRGNFPEVSQQTLLGPGQHTLKGLYQGSLVSPSGLVWRVTCRSGNVIAATENIRGKFPDWRPFTLKFTVPPTGCRSQQITLDLDAKTPSEMMATGTIFFDDLEITRGG